jgi:hypothetical protein
MERAQQVLERIRLFAMPEGPLQCKGTWLRQVGEMRFAPGRRSFPFEADQWFEGGGIEFRWKARARMAPLVRVGVIDEFKEGRGELAARLFGVIPVAQARGPAADRGEAMRGLAELPWRPFAFREGTGIAWEVLPAGKLRATFDDGGTHAAVEFEVAPEGRVLGVAVPSRPRLVGKSVVDTPWSGAFREYRMFDGLQVPTEAEVTWHLPEGPFTYWRARVTDFRALK